MIYLFNIKNNFWNDFFQQQQNIYSKIKVPVTNFRNWAVFRENLSSESHKFRTMFDHSFYSEFSQLYSKVTQQEVTLIYPLTFGGRVQIIDFREKKIKTKKWKNLLCSQ